MKGYYKPSDIRKDGLLKMKKLKERDAVINPPLKPKCKDCGAPAMTRDLPLCGACYDGYAFDDAMERIRHD